MKELDEMEKVNARLSTAVEDVMLEHSKKAEVYLLSLIPPIDILLPIYIFLI